MLRVDEPGEPDEIIWENADYSVAARYLQTIVLEKLIG